MRYDDEERIRGLEEAVADLTTRLERLEGRPEKAAVPPPPPQPEPQRGWDAEEFADLEEERVPWERDREGAPLRAPSLPSVDLEELLGGRVLAWVGAIAVVLGVVFFLAMAVSRGWIDEPTRVVLAYLGSSALLGVGLYLYERQGRTQAALAAVATAIAALYLSTTAATTLYELVEPAIGLGIAGLVGAAATAIAVRWSSPIVAGIGIVGALLAPVFVDAGTSVVALAFMAIALVAATGVLIWRKWDWLALAAFVTSAPQLIGWVFDRDDEIALSLVVVGLFWALYVVASIGYELRVPTERLRLSSASLLLADAVLSSGLGWWVLEENGHGDAATVWVIGAAAAHIALGSATFRGRISREVALLLLAVGIGLSAIAAALALDGPALVAAWSVEAVILTWLARTTGEGRGYFFAAGFLVLAAAHTLFFDAPPIRLFDDPDATAIVAVVLVTVAAFASARLYAGPWRAFSAGGDALALAGLAYLPPIAFEGVPVVAAWAAIAVALTLLGPRGLVGDMGIAAPAFVGLAAAHALLVEAPPNALREGVDDLAAAALALALVVGSAVAIFRLVEAPPQLNRALEIGAAAFAVYLPSVAIVDLTATGEEFEPGQTPQVLLSAFWSLTGLAAIVYGLLRDDKRFRLGGLGLLGLAVAKVGIYDLQALDAIYRVLSFIALGLLLLAGAFAYQRIGRTTRESR